MNLRIDVEGQKVNVKLGNLTSQFESIKEIFADMHSYEFNVKR